jgi:hypothetical protein
MHHLGTHTPNGNNLHGPDTSPKNIDNFKTGMTGPSGGAAQVLGAFTVLCQTADASTAYPHTAGKHAAMMSDFSKEMNTLLLANFSGIGSQISFLLHQATGHVKCATNRPASSGTTNFKAQKGVGAIRLAVSA